MKGKRKSELICIIGVDGTGKTTHAQKLLNEMKNEGVPCKYTWFRFNHFFSLILLAYCRLAGLTVYERTNGQDIGRHEFYRSKIISFLYPWMLFIDILPMYFIKISIPLHIGYTIVCDRYIYDTLADLMIDLNDLNIHRKIIGKFFLRLFPIDTKAIILDLDEETIRERRIDLMGDRSLERRRKVYKQIAKDFDIPIIENTGSIKEVHKNIVSLLQGGRSGR